MLRIHEGIPIKQMALYGSAAFIVGFAGTLTVLREYVPQTGSGDISVVHPSNRDQAKASVSNQVSKGSTETTTLNPAAPLVEGAPATTNDTLTTRQASPIPIASSNNARSGSGAMAVTQATPTTTTTPTTGTSPQPPTGSSTSSAPAAQQPAPASGTDQTVTSGLQQTVSDINKTATGLLP